MGHDSVFLHSFYRKALFRLIFRSNWAKLKDGLPDSIMVVRQILVLFVLVRIQVGQQAPLAIARGVFVFIMKLPFETVDLHSFSLLAGNHGLPRASLSPGWKARMCRNYRHSRSP